MKLLIVTKANPNTGEFEAGTVEVPDNTVATHVFTLQQHGFIAREVVSNIAEVAADNNVNLPVPTKESK